MYFIEIVDRENTNVDTFFEIQSSLFSEILLKVLFSPVVTAAHILCWIHEFKYHRTHFFIYAIQHEDF